jgi:DNA primase
MTRAYIVKFALDSLDRLGGGGRARHLQSRRSTVAHPASQATSILAVASALGMEVTGRRARCFNGAAHNSGADQNPSLVFQTDVNRFRCHACGTRGDAIDLVRGVLGVSFAEAVHRLNALAGRSPGNVPPIREVAAATPKTSSGMPTPRAKEVYARLFELSESLTKESPAGKYLRGRGIDIELANRSWVREMASPPHVWGDLRKEIGEAELLAAGLVSHSGRFLFAGHSLLLFHFDKGRPQFVRARDITGTSSCKELSLAGVHSPVPYFSDVLHDRPERVLVCEGCIDTLSAAQLGYAAVGVPGVTGFRDDWFPLFRDVGRVTVLFDNDEAGRRQGAELRSQFRRRRIVADAMFPARGKDLNDLLKSLQEGAVP